MKASGRTSTNAKIAKKIKNFLIGFRLKGLWPRLVPSGWSKLSYVSSGNKEPKIRYNGSGKSINFKVSRSLDPQRALENRVLWINGGPGVGKSIMARYLIDTLNTLHSEAIVLYFFCKRNVPGLTDVQDIIRTLAFQCIKNKAARSVLEALKRTNFKTDDHVGVDDLFHRLLGDPISAANTDVFIILDGLDEANNAKKDDLENRRQLKILWECLQTLKSCQLIILSRPMELLEKIPESDTMSITSKENADDIRVYVKNEMSDVVEELGKYFAERNISPVDYFVSASNGIFLWVFLILQQFKQSSSKTKKAIEKDLKDLLEGTGDSQLDDRFSIALSSNSRDDQIWVKWILLFLIVGVRDVDVDELEGAINIAVDDSRQFKRFLQVQCGSLLALQPNLQGGETVRLIHETFASFLVDAKRCQPPMYFVDRDKAHCEIAELCLRVMSTKDAESNAFLPYAASFWVDHLNRATKKGEQCKGLLVQCYQFFTSPSLSIWIKHGLTKIPYLSANNIFIEDSSVQDINRWLRCVKGIDSSSLTADKSQLLEEALKWRVSLLHGTQHLGTVIGKAAARVWLNESLGEFNRTATCFLLALKHTSNNPELDRLIADEFRDLSIFAEQDTVRAPTLNLGVAYFTLGQWAECIERFNSAGTTAFSLKRYLGDAYNAKGDYDDAINAFSTAIEENPNDSLSYIGLSEAFKGKKDYDGAIKVFTDGYTKNPNDPWFLKKLGDAYVTKRDYKSAITTFQKAIDMNPTDSWLWEKLGTAFKERKDYPMAIKTFETARAKFPTISRLWRCLAQTHQTAGDEEKAREILEAAINQFPKALSSVNQAMNVMDIKSGSSVQRRIWLVTEFGDIDSSPPSDPFRGSPFRYWGVFVSPLSRNELELKMAQTMILDVTEIWGDLHELWNQSGVAQYRNQKFRAHNFQYSTKATYQGETQMYDGELERLGVTYEHLATNLIGDQLSEYCQTYRSFLTQCSTWAQLFCNRSRISSGGIPSPIES